MNVWIDNSNLVELNGLKDKSADAYMNTASVRLTLFEPGGVTEVASATWPLALTYVTSSNGIYRGSITNLANFVEGHIYRAVVTASVSGGLVGKWNVPTKAITRET